MNQQQADDITIEIESRLWRLRLQPGIGLQTQACQILHANQWHDIMPDCRSPDAPLSASNFHMLPYSNRVRDGKFSHRGETIELENAAKHAIHGALRDRQWRVTDHTNHSVAAEYDTRVDGQVSWPWPIQAQIIYSLSDDTLTSEMLLTNHGSSPMPAGMGWHPYFCRVVAGASPQLTISVNGMYPDTNGDCLPTGAAIALPENLNFATARDLDPEQRIDHCLSGFASPATIAWPAAGIKLSMHASSNCSHAVLFNPDKPYFAFEPVTNANDGFNLAAKGIDAGVVELEPGETLRAQMQLKLGN